MQCGRSCRCKCPECTRQTGSSSQVPKRCKQRCFSRPYKCCPTAFVVRWHTQLTDTHTHTLTLNYSLSQLCTHTHSALTLTLIHSPVIHARTHGCSAVHIQTSCMSTLRLRAGVGRLSHAWRFRGINGRTRVVLLSSGSLSRKFYSGMVGHCTAACWITLALLGGVHSAVPTNGTFRPLTVSLYQCIHLYRSHCLTIYLCLCAL